MSDPATPKFSAYLRHLRGDDKSQRLWRCSEAWFCDSIPATMTCFPNPALHQSIGLTIYAPDLCPVIGMDINRMFHGMAKTIETTQSPNEAYPVTTPSCSLTSTGNQLKSALQTRQCDYLHPPFVIPDSRRIQHGVVINFRNGSQSALRAKRMDMFGLD